MRLRVIIFCQAANTFIQGVKSLFQSLTAIGILFFAISAWSQNTVFRQHSLAASYLQVDESLNYGLIFRGPSVAYGLSYQWESGPALINYEFGAGLAYLRSPQEVEGAVINMAPVRISYLLKPVASKKVYIGPSLIAAYNFALYPDLQSGYSFWFTHYSLGAEFVYVPDARSVPLSFRFRTSLMGATSRPPLERDAYFFDLSFSSALEDLHSNLNFGSWNVYNVSDLEIGWHPKRNRLSFSYALQYAGYYDDPRLTILNHQFKVLFPPKIKSR